MIVEQLTRARQLTAIEYQMCVIHGSRASGGRRRSRCELRRLDLAVLTCREIRVVYGSPAQRHVERQCRLIRRRRYQLGYTRDETAARRHHPDRIVGAAGTPGIGEIDVKLVVTIGQRDLVLLAGVVEADIGYRRTAARIDEGDDSAGDRRSRDRVIDDTVRVDGQIEVKQVAAFRNLDVVDTLQTILVIRVGLAKHCSSDASAWRTET